MNKQETVPQDSPTNPLPSAKFRCRRAWSNRTEAADTTYVFDVRSVLFGAQTRFFPAVREDAAA
jgi:hypothetical protein